MTDWAIIDTMSEYQKLALLVARNETRAVMGVRSVLAALSLRGLIVDTLLTPRGENVADLLIDEASRNDAQAILCLSVGERRAVVDWLDNLRRRGDRGIRVNLCPWPPFTRQHWTRDDDDPRYPRRYLTPFGRRVLGLTVWRQP